MKYRIRRAILEALFEYDNPQTLKTVLLYHGFPPVFRHIVLTEEDRQDVSAEWRYLIDKGYIQTVPEFDGYARNSADVDARLAEFKRNPAGPDPFAHDLRISGPAALGR